MLRVSLLLLCLGVPLSADEVELNDGTILEGKVTDLGDSVRITRGSGSMTIPKASVKRIEYKKTRAEIYEEKAREVKDLDGHLALAKWCVEVKLKKEAEIEFRKVIALQPDHEEARAALGYRKYNGAWMTEDEIQTAKGLVKHKGKWMTPAERDLDLALDAQKELDKRLVAEVQKCLDKMRTESGRKEARERLDQIADPYKVKPFLSSVTTYNEYVRKFVVEELGRMKELTASKPLARVAIWDTKPEIRAAALASLVAIQNPDTAIHLLPFLSEDSTSARIRTEGALARFQDLRSVPALIQVCAQTVDTLRFIEEYEGQMERMIRRTLTLRNGQQVQIPPNIRIDADLFDKETKAKLNAEKEACLAALRAITGQEFSDDLARWADWYRKNKK